MFLFYLTVDKITSSVLIQVFLSKY